MGGTRSLNCDIHFFELPSCSGGGGGSLDGEKFAIFPSWMSFLNEPDEYDGRLTRGCKMVLEQIWTSVPALARAIPVKSQNGPWWLRRTSFQAGNSLCYTISRTWMVS